MKQRNVALFLGAQLLFVFLHIHKHIFFIKTSFDRQKKERRRDQLLQQKEFTIQQLQAAQNKTGIKEFAVTELKFQPIRMHQIRRLNHHEPTV